MTLIKAEIVQKDFGGREKELAIWKLQHWLIKSQRISGFQCGLKSTFWETSEAWKAPISGFQEEVSEATRASGILGKQTWFIQSSVLPDLHRPQTHFFKMAFGIAHQVAGEMLASREVNGLLQKRTEIRDKRSQTRSKLFLNTHYKKFSSRISWPTTDRSCGVNGFILLVISHQKETSLMIYQSHMETCIKCSKSD